MLDVVRISLFNITMVKKQQDKVETLKENDKVSQHSEPSFKKRLFKFTCLKLGEIALVVSLVLLLHFSFLFIANISGIYGSNKFMDSNDICSYTEYFTNQNKTIVNSISNSYSQASWTSTLECGGEELIMYIMVIDILIPILILIFIGLCILLAYGLMKWIFWNWEMSK